MKGLGLRLLRFRAYVSTYVCMYMYICICIYVYILCPRFWVRSRPVDSGCSTMGILRSPHFWVERASGLLSSFLWNGAETCRDLMGDLGIWSGKANKQRQLHLFSPKLKQTCAIGIDCRCQSRHHTNAIRHPTPESKPVSLCSVSFALHVICSPKPGAAVCTTRESPASRPLEKKTYQGCGASQVARIPPKLRPHFYPESPTWLN